MTDEEFLLAFENCTLSAEQWTHRAHVRAAYLYATRNDIDSAIDKMRSSIQRFNAATNTPEAIDRGYHETMTQAFMRLIHKAIAEDGLHTSSHEFCERHPELLDKRVLRKFYSRDRIMSWKAKGDFVEPDLLPLSTDSLMAKPDHLVIFDVDGTLIQSVGIDDRCFSQAVSDVLDVHDISTDWSTYQYQTDSGLIFEIASKRLGSPPSAKLTRQVRERYIELLRQQSNEDGFILDEVQGANALLDSLRHHSKWRAAIATGGWEAPAKLKLHLAGVNVDQIPFASSDNAMPREEIIQCAIAQSGQQAEPGGFHEIVYVGDGSWDAVAAERLGIGFVGVQTNAAKPVFDSQTATVADFANPQAFIALLDFVTSRNY